MRGVAGDAEVGDLHVAKVFVEDVLAARIALRIGLDIPQVGDRVAEEQDVEVAVGGDVHECLMARVLRASGGTDAGIVARNLNRQQRFVFPQQFLVGRRLNELSEIRVHPGNFFCGWARNSDLRRHRRRRPGR